MTCCGSPVRLQTWFMYNLAVSLAYDCFITRGKDSGLAETIHYNKERIKSLRYWKVCDEVHGDYSPYVGWDLIWLQGYFILGLYLGCLTCGTSVHIILDKGGYSWPPEFS